MVENPLVYLVSFSPMGLNTWGNLLTFRPLLPSALATLNAAFGPGGGEGETAYTRRISPSQAISAGTV